MSNTQRASYYVIVFVLVVAALLLASVVEAHAEALTTGDLMCVAVDPWGYGSEFGDMMRPCNEEVASFEVTVTSKPHRTSKPTEVTPPPATQTPPPIVTTPPPPVVTTPPTPTKECKNKNSGKDGTPGECNAGKGQEKHDG